MPVPLNIPSTLFLRQRILKVSQHSSRESCSRTIKPGSLPLSPSKKLLIFSSGKRDSKKNPVFKPFFAGNISRVIPFLRYPHASTFMTCRHITERMLSDVKRRYDRLISCGEPGFFPAVNIQPLCTCSPGSLRGKRSPIRACFPAGEMRSLPG